MELCVWPGSSGLASIDSNCLQALAYVRFCAVPGVKKVSVKRFLSVLTTGQLPRLQHTGSASSGFHSIAQYLRSIGHDCDNALTSAQVADVTAWNHYVINKLTPALTYMKWRHEENYRNNTRKYWLSQLPFPIGFYLVDKWKREADKYLAALFDSSLSDEALQQHLYSEAEKCLSSVAKRLADSNYMAGSAPCSLDAVLYGFLAPLLNSCWSGERLSSVVRAHSPLVDFVRRVDRKYISPDISNEEDATSGCTSGDPGAFTNTLRNSIFFSTMTAAAFLGYAFTHGFAQLSMGDVDGEMDEDEYE